jgi:type 1 glutamine amidotransferase
MKFSSFSPLRKRNWSPAVAALSLVVGLGLAQPRHASAVDAKEAKKADRKLKVLYLDQSMGFRHRPVMRNGGELAQSEKVMQEIAEKTGKFDVEVTQDAKVITAEKLKDLDVLAFYTTGALPISDENWKAVLKWLEDGHGFVGIHSATDTGWNYKGEGMSYTQLINGKFAGHPWTEGSKITLISHDSEHPTVKMWGPEAKWDDEIYQYQDYDPSVVRVLQSLNFETTPLKKPYLVPVTWVRQVGKGRLFYTNLGHTPKTWDEPRFREQIVAGIRFAAGLEEGSTKPNPEVQAQWAIHSFLSATQAEGAKAAGGTGDGKSGESPTAVVARLKGAEKEWLTSTARDIAKLREIRKSNPTKPKKAGDDDEKYQKELAKYQKDLREYEEGERQYPIERDRITADVLKKAGAGTASAR